MTFRPFFNLRQSGRDISAPITAREALINTANPLTRFYQQFQSTDQVLIVINADPDAIASAKATKRLLWRKTAGVTIAHVNAIERPDNLAMIESLEIEMTPLAAISGRPYHRLIILDSQPDHFDAPLPRPPDVIIDHHPPGDIPARGYFDIRPSYGATASILSEYLQSAGITPSWQLATALYLGIKVDTRNFERQGILADIKAFEFIYPFVDTRQARLIEQAEIRSADLKYFVRAIQRHQEIDQKVFTHLGKIENPDLVVILADFFIRLKNIRWSVVFGVYQQNLIVVIRHIGEGQAHAGQTAEAIFGKMGLAGGHRSMARAEISRERFRQQTGLTRAEEIQDWIARQFKAT